MAGARGLVLLAKRKTTRSSNPDAGSSVPAVIPPPNAAVEAAALPAGVTPVGVAEVVATSSPDGGGSRPPKRTRVAPPPIAIDLSQEEGGEADPSTDGRGGSVLGSLWDNPISDALDNFVMTEQDEARVTSFSEEELSKQAYYIEKYCLRGASMASLIRRKPELILAPNREKEQMQKRLADSDAEVARLTAKLEEMHRELEKQTKLKDEALDSKRDAIDRANRLKDNWTRYEQQAREEASELRSSNTKLTSKALKHKKESARFARLWEKATDESFKNAVIQLSFLNPGGIITRGADPLFQVIDGKLVDHRQDGAEVDLTSPDLPDPLQLPGLDGVSTPEEDIPTEPLSPLSE